MSASGTWTDPNSGLDYPFGSKLPYTGANSILTGLREIDKAQALMGARNFVADASLNAFPRDVVFDPYTGLAIVVGDKIDRMFDGQSGGFLAATIPLSFTLINCVASNSAGTMVCGYTPPGATATKLASSVDGGANWTDRSASASDANGVVGVEWFSSKFVAVTGTGAATGRIDYSADGITWTNATNPVSYTLWAHSPNGGISTSSTACIVVPDASTTQFVRSTDGVSWSAVTVPGLWYVGAANTTTHGWFAVTKSGAANIAQSSDDGLTWTTSGTATLPSGYQIAMSLSSVGNAVLMMWRDLVSTYYSVSTDGCVTWETIASWSGSSYRAAKATNNQVYSWIPTTNQLFVGARGSW
jgi:hypothetical protein